MVDRHRRLFPDTHTQEVISVFEHQSWLELSRIASAPSDPAQDAANCWDIANKAWRAARRLENAAKHFRKASPDLVTVRFIEARERMLQLAERALCQGRRILAGSPSTFGFDTEPRFGAYPSWKLSQSTRPWAPRELQR